MVRSEYEPYRESNEAAKGRERVAAAEGRWACEYDFDSQGFWNGKRYQTKRVRPIFVEEPEEIVVVTVYVYCF